MTAFFSFSTSVMTIIFTALILTSCISDPPREEYSIARSAIQAAKKSGASKHAPGFWYKASSLFKKGEKFFRNKEPGKAREYFIRARRYAERAESSAKLSQAQGDDFE